MSRGQSNAIRFVFLIVICIGIILIYSALTELTQTTDNIFDDFLLNLSRFALNSVPLLTLEIPFAGGFGIVFTLGGTIAITR